MRTAVIVAFAILSASCSRPTAPIKPRPSAAPAQAASESAVEKAAAEKAAIVKPLTATELKDLLGRRLDGGMGDSFSQFANMFLVMSRINLGYGVALIATTKTMADTELQSPFPESYQPTLREFLDAIALQTFSTWKYDPSSKHFESNVPGERAAPGLAIFEFTKTEREKPFEVTLAKGWNSIDKGNWVMLVPPSFPVGMDIYEPVPRTSE